MGPRSKTFMQAGEATQKSPAGGLLSFGMTLPPTVDKWRNVPRNVADKGNEEEGR